MRGPPLVACKQNVAFHNFMSEYGENAAFSSLSQCEIASLHSHTRICICVKYVSNHQQLFSNLDEFAYLQEREREIYIYI